MIEYISDKKLFHLSTKSTSYLFFVNPFGHLEHRYFASKTTHEYFDSMATQFALEVGNQVIYEASDRSYSLNLASLEVPTYGKGDFREVQLFCRFPDNTSILDLKYVSHEIMEGIVPLKDLPQAKATSKTQSLIVKLLDSVRNLEVLSIYTVFDEEDLITRRLRINNLSQDTVSIHKALSATLDFTHKNFEVITLDGAWIKERQVTNHKIDFGIFKIDSKKGVSSNDHNPSILFKESNTTEDYGIAYGMSLVYSGNFEATFEVSPHELTRVMMGINSFDFLRVLHSEESFETPEVAMTFSASGLNTLSKHFHDFISRAIVPISWQNVARPIVINNWEATFFDFTESKLLALAKKAKQLGIEMFVLDDGWFGKRDDDTSSLGDWTPNSKKLKKGLAPLVKKIRNLGLQFGLWVEPEMVNPDSELYRHHPQWAIEHPLYPASFGRNQLILDLAQEEVVEYLFDTLSTVFQSADISYVKWDMNRNFSDIWSPIGPAKIGSHNYEYQVGLYRLLRRLTEAFPTILFEACASGGNRFDMGMLCYMPQIWTSDNTDAYERQKIQYGTSYIYPPSVMSSHVSEIPNYQTIRKTPLETRFNVAAFGLLGYELDFTQLTPFEEKTMKNQIEYYKTHRQLFQYGVFERIQSPFENNLMMWRTQSSDESEGIYGIYQRLEMPNNHLERIKIHNDSPNSRYRITSRSQHFSIDMFGHLTRHALPIRLNAKGMLFHWLSNRYVMKSEQYQEDLSGAILQDIGFAPMQNFIGTGYTDRVRLMGDFGSRLYHYTQLKEVSYASDDTTQL